MSNGHDELMEAEIVDPGTAIGAYVRAEIDMQITTAKQYPRVLTDCKRDAEELACMDEETAAGMFYSLKRGGKRIEGPSIRFAEVIAYAWTNLRFEAKVVSIDDHFVTAEGSCFDIQRNTAGRGQCKRRITNREGVRFGEDMIGVTANAACSIALRNAIFKVVPRALFKTVMDKAKDASLGKGTTQERRANALEAYQRAGKDEAAVLKYLGRKGVDDITIEDLIELRGLHTAVHENLTTIDKAFMERDATRNPPMQMNDLTDPKGGAEEGPHPRTVADEQAAKLYEDSLEPTGTTSAVGPAAEFTADELAAMDGQHPDWCRGYGDAVKGKNTNPFKVDERRDRWESGFRSYHNGFEGTASQTPTTPDIHEALDFYKSHIDLADLETLSGILTDAGQDERLNPTQYEMVANMSDARRSALEDT